ncbi:hypothetical protein AVO45_15640 [Ruegeria marisrubri]|uniref:FHA domain-containing protein n=1 Tax=Ruegeria marisrubri TaxID=1685379 RepID=A0A0X3TBV9_9RHOB|nr:FHA domain-containing protein [Ruegeria marisrubri]KUJ73173.1 hypothetical protein AVO45_15640 [Ruegeria marisrubri]
MFKYKSPLSRLLEGGGKTRDAAEDASTPPEAEKPEPIADFNALRAVLTGGNAPQEAYDDSDELIPEETMPEFDEAAPEAGEAESEAETEEALDVAEAEEVETEEISDKDEADETEQVVTLHMNEAPAQTDTPKPAAEVQSEPEAPAATDPEPAYDEVISAAVAATAAKPEPETPEPQPAAPAEDRRGRVKTTFLGFERPDTHVQDLMDGSPVAKATVAQATYPVGWLVITSGPGRGTAIVLTEGLMQIGRNDDQAIQLDFGDTGISRSNHAVIAYDPEDRKCYLGHGGKANLVRLNGGPVLSTVPLSHGDTIRISETSMRFVAFCDETFDWRDA